MIGVDAGTGRIVRDEDYLKSRIKSCLSMREGTHPMRRQKGSRIPELLDRPLNANTLFDIQVAVMDAMDSAQNGFKDLDVLSVKASAVESGGVSILLQYRAGSELLTLEGMVISK